MGLREVGEKAPDFELLDETGTPRKLSVELTVGPVVLFFYPKDETTVCTKEACGFRDQFEPFQSCGARVFGVSQDGVESHRSFKRNHSLQFSLLTDKGGDVAAAFGVKKLLGLVPGRATFVIDRLGIVRSVSRSALRAEPHVEESLRVLRNMERL